MVNAISTTPASVLRLLLGHNAISTTSTAVLREREWVN